MESSHINLSVSGRISHRRWQQDSHKPPTVGFETSSSRFIPILRSISQAKSNRSYLYSGTSGRLLCFIEIAGAKVRWWLLPKTISFMAGLGTSKTHSHFSCLIHTVNTERKDFLLQKRIVIQRLAPLATIVLWTVISSLLDHLLANTDHLPVGNYMVPLSFVCEQ